VDELDHLPPEHSVQVLVLPEHHQTLEVHCQNLLRQVSEQEFVLQVLVAPEVVSKFVAVVELLAKE
jgi:hypothetical protein